MTRTLPAVLALAILVSPAVAVAQTHGARLADVVTTGLKVSVVDGDGRRIDGRVVALSQETLRVSLRGSTEDIPLDRIVRIDEPDTLRNGALTGLGIGLAVGTFGTVLSSGANIEPEWLLASIGYKPSPGRCSALASTPCSTTVERCMSVAVVSRPASRPSSGAASAARRYRCPGSEWARRAG